MECVSQSGTKEDMVYALVQVKALIMPKNTFLKQGQSDATDDGKILVLPPGYVATGCSFAIYDVCWKETSHQTMQLSCPPHVFLIRLQKSTNVLSGPPEALQGDEHY